MSSGREQRVVDAPLTGGPALPHAAASRSSARGMAARGIGGGDGSGGGGGGGGGGALRGAGFGGSAAEAMGGAQQNAVGGGSGGGTTRRMKESFEAKRALVRLKLQKAANAKLHEKEAHLQRELPTDLKNLVDVDGDGHIDAEEFRLMRQLTKITKDDLVDVDGDGQIDDDELLLARQVAGKRMLAANFVERNMGRMWRYGAELGSGATPEECVDKIVKARNYRGLMHFLHDKERIDRVSGSSKLAEVLRQPVTDRPVTFRPRIYDQFKHAPIN
jgi:hypothetical protein